MPTPVSLSGLVAAMLCFCLSLPAAAQEARLLVQRAQVAGFAYHAGAQLWPQLKVGESVRLVLECDNPHDPQAVRIDYSGSGEAATLGYLGREENGAVARALAEGQPLQARISRLRETKNPRNRIEIEIWVAVTSLKRPSP